MIRPGCHEGEREQEDARVTAQLSPFPRSESEAECDPARKAEHAEVHPVVLEVRVELRAKKQRKQSD